MDKRELFEKAVYVLCDFEKINMVGGYGGLNTIFHRIESNDSSVDQIFVNIYKVVDVVYQIKTNPMLIRIEEERKNIRMLIDAFFHQAKGNKATIMSVSEAESRFIQNEYAYISEELSGSSQIGVGENKVNFIVAHRYSLRDVHLTQYDFVMQGFETNQKLFITQEAIKEHFIKINDPFVVLLDKYEIKNLDISILNAEEQLKINADKRLVEQRILLQYLFLSDRHY